MSYIPSSPWLKRYDSKTTVIVDIRRIHSRGSARGEELAILITGVTAGRRKAGRTGLVLLRTPKYFGLQWELVEGYLQHMEPWNFIDDTEEVP